MSRQLPMKIKRHVGVAGNLLRLMAIVVGEKIKSLIGESTHEYHARMWSAAVTSAQTASRRLHLPTGVHLLPPISKRRHGIIGQVQIRFQGLLIHLSSSLLKIPGRARPSRALDFGCWIRARNSSLGIYRPPKARVTGVIIWMSSH